MPTDQLAVLFVDLAVVLGSCAALGALATRLRQPPVIGELVAGVLLGPTVLGSWSDVLFPVSNRPLLGALGDVGVALFMFSLGAEFGTARVLGRAWNATAIALGSLAVSFAMGVGTAAVLLHLGRQPRTSALGFVLFMGVAMSVTAFPVLARILSERGIAATGVGRLAMTLAGLTDVLCWSVLAVCIAVIDGTSSGAWRLTLLVPLVIVLRYAVAPVVRRMVAARASRRADSGTVVVLLAGALLSGAATEAIGMHFIIGAFLFGLLAARGGVDPRRGPPAQAYSQVGQVSRILMPVFFATAGLAVHVRFDAGSIALVALVTGAGLLGKIGGTFVSARACRIPPMPSAALAALMNTRGLTEVIVLTTGLQLGIIDHRLYTAMVIMALGTTIATGPLLTAIAARGRLRNQDALNLDVGAGRQLAPNYLTPN